MKRIVVLFSCVVSLAIASDSLNAQTYYRLELYGSANVPFDKDFEISMPQATTPIPGTFHVSPGVRGGLRVGVDGLRHWGQDISYSYGTSSARISVPGNGEFDFQSHSHQFAYNAVFYPGGLNRSKVLPYLTAGAGGTIYTLPQASIDKAQSQGLGTLSPHTSFTFNAGGGLRYQFTDRVGLRFDARDWMSHPPRYGIPASSPDPTVFVFPVKGVYHQLEASVSFVYCFRSSH